MDPVADALIRIKNGYMAGKRQILIRNSKLIWNLCQLLSKEGFIGEVNSLLIGEAKKSIGDTNIKGRDIVVTLKYNDRSPAVTDVKRVSKPGLRVYKGAKSLPRVLNGLGIAIISTPKGVMTDKQARKLGLGGEVMAEVW